MGATASATYAEGDEVWVAPVRRLLELARTAEGAEGVEGVEGPTFAAETLSRRELDVLRLLDSELTGPEIAACTGLAEGSVRVNLHRGMALLRAALGEPQANKTKEKSA